MIVIVGRQTSQDVKEYEGVEGLDNKDSLLSGLTNNNIGSTYTELKADKTAINGVWKLNRDGVGLAWYKV